METSPALTPLFVPFRPFGHGWAAYHDLEPETGRAGLGMTWRAPDGALRYVLALDRQREGQAVFAGRLGEGDSVAEAVNECLNGKSATTVTETAALALLLPPEEGFPESLFGAGLPPAGERRAAARRAVRAATLPAGVREAFEALTQRRCPSGLDLSRLRARSFKALWPAMGLAASNPVLGRMALAARPGLLAEPDPMAAVLGAWPGLTEAHLRRLRGPDAPYATSYTTSMASAFLDLLSGSPVDWWPRKEEWESFGACAQAVRAISSGWPGAPAAGTLASASKGDWPAFERRLRRAAAVPIDATPRSHAVAAMAADCADPVRSLANGLLIPLLARRVGEEAADGLQHDGAATNAALSAAGSLLYADKAAAAVLETSRTWHARREALEAELRSEGGTASWPRLFEGEFRVGPVGIVCISDYETLKEEGSRERDRRGVHGLGHCVASRLEDCLSGAAHVLSVRLHGEDGSVRRLSTCQISAHPLPNEQVRVSLDEHRAAGNDQPCRQAVEAVEGFARELAAGRVPANPEAFSPQGRTGHGLALLCGYDWRDDAAARTAYEAWSPFLPRWAQGLDPDELLSALPANGIPSLPEPEDAPAPFAP